MAASPRCGAALLALALLSACALLRGSAAGPACVVDLIFATGPQTASLSLGGSLVEPISIPIRHTTVAGVAGNASVVMMGACPTPQGLPAALATARLWSVPASGFRIAAMEARIANWADILIQNFQGVFESPGPVTAPDGSSPFRVRATGGSVRITGRKGGVTEVQLAPETMAGHGCAVFSGGLGVITLKCPSVVLYRRLDVKGDGNQIVDIQVQGVLNAYGKLAAARTVIL